jgi:hypothetical protein
MQTQISSALTRRGLIAPALAIPAVLSFAGGERVTIRMGSRTTLERPRDMSFPQFNDIHHHLASRLQPDHAGVAA